MKRILLLAFVLTICLILPGCGSKTSGGQGNGTRGSTPKVLTPSADGGVAFSCDVATIDASHLDAGYVMVNYTGTNSKVKLQLTLPDASIYTYDLHGGWEVFPLSGGNGNYTLTIFENIGGDQYATAFSQSIDVALTDEFGPFLYPNQYVWYTADSNAVSLSQELASTADTDLDVITSVYDYITQNITYDNAAAEAATTGYVPNIDAVLANKTGICFDYASSMAALLRLQGIPTRVEVGYSGSTYHAWISAYTTEAGWVENVIEFDGSQWTLMDPTLAANNSNSSVKDYVGDGSHYTTKYLY